MEHLIADPVRERYRRILITGARGQLGTALAVGFPEAHALGRLELDVAREVPEAYDLVLHAARGRTSPERSPSRAPPKT